MPRKKVPKSKKKVRVIKKGTKQWLHNQKLISRAAARRKGISEEPDCQDDAFMEEPVLDEDAPEDTQEKSLEFIISHSGMELGSKEKTEENSQLTSKVKLIRKKGTWKTDNEQEENKSKMLRRNNEGHKKIKTIKRHAPAQFETNANNSVENPEDNNNIFEMPVHKMATEDELNNIICEQVSVSIVPPVPEEESVHTELWKPSPESLILFLDHDYGIRQIPLTKGGRSNHHENLESAKQGREEESDYEVEMLKEIPAEGLKMNVTEIKGEIEDREIPEVTDEEPNKTRNIHYDDNAAQAIIKEDPKVLNSETLEEIRCQEDSSGETHSTVGTDSVDLGHVTNDGDNIVLCPVTGILIQGEVESPQAEDNHHVGEQQQKGISVQGRQHQGDNQVGELQEQGTNDIGDRKEQSINEKWECQEEGVNEVRERQQKGVIVTRKCQQESVNEVREWQQKGVNVTRECQKEGVNEVRERQQKGVNVTRECQKEGVNEVRERQQQGVIVMRDNDKYNFNIC